VASDPTAQQTISGLVVGATYLVQGDVACGNICTPAGTIAVLSFGVLLDGTPVLELHTPSSQTSWRHFNPTFVATSTTHVLGFAGERNGSDFDPRIDNISLECVQNCPTATVPEPASLLLIGSGLVALMSVRRKQRS